MQVGFIELKQLMSKGTLAPEPLGCLEEQRWDQTLGVGVELKAVLHFSALGFRSYECGCPREYTGLQPACDGVRGWVSLSPIFNPPQGAPSCCCLFGNQIWMNKTGRAKRAEEGWGFMTDGGGSTDLLLDRVTAARWTDQILWLFLEQEFWTRITPQIHKQRGLGSTCGCCRLWSFFS